MDGLFYIMDLLFIPEIFIIMNYIFKFKMRRLNDYEKLISKSFFGDKSIDVDKVLVDDRALITKKHRIAFVSFNIINYYGRIKDETLIHELVHVYQFQKFGFVYVYRALKAQFSKEGYDYGGIDGLVQALKKKKKYFEFNFEQQASIIEHYFIITQDESLRTNENLVSLYRHFYLQCFEPLEYFEYFEYFE
jgi:hypothetical protein